MARRPRNCELALVQSDRELRESDWTNLIGRDRASEVWDCGGARAYRISLRTIRATVYDPSMMKTEIFPIADIYVPVKRRATLDPARVRKIAESMLETGQQTPILVRPDGKRFVLVEGLHRLEACKELGETTIRGYLVQARRH